MQRDPRFWLGAVVGLAAVLGGCTADGGDAGIIVLRSVAPSDMCTFSSSDSELTVSQGTLDASFGAGYQLGIQMISRITALTGQEVQRSVFVTGAKVDVAFPDSMLFTAAELTELRTGGLTHFKSLFSTPIRPNGGITDVAFDAIPFELVGRVRAKPGFTSVVALVSFQVVGGLGTTGDDLESDPYQFAVTITNGGLVNLKGACADLSTAFEPRSGNGCGRPQDGIIDCCTAPDNTLVCPAVGTKT